MRLPADWDCEEHCPSGLFCRRCRDIMLVPTRAFRVLATGIVEQLYVCQGCLWGHTVRYDPHKPGQYIVCELISPGQSRFGYVLSKNRKKGGG